MRTRTLVAGLAAGLVATAAGNRVLGDRVPAVGPALDGRQRTYRWRGFDISYVTAGDPDNDDVVLVHGLHSTASNREFEGIFTSLAADHHVVAIDLLGYGASDRPAIRYTGALYESLLRDFLADVVESPIVIASSLPGSFVAAIAPEIDVRSLVLVAPFDETGEANSLVRAVIYSPVIGEAIFNLLVSKPAIRYFDLEMGYGDPGAVTETRVDRQYRTAHQPNARFAPGSYLANFLEASEPLDESIPAFDGSVTLVWGREAKRPRLSTGRSLAEATDVKLVVLDRSALFPHDEYPDEFLDAVAPSLPGFEDDQAIAVGRRSTHVG